MHPLPNRIICVFEPRPFATSESKECVDQIEHLDPVSSCSSCQQVLRFLLNILQEQSNRIVQPSSSDSTSVLLSTEIQNLLNVNVTEIGSPACQKRDCCSNCRSRQLASLVSRIHLRKGDWCLMLQNGMAQQAERFYREQDDSGFGSGGPSFSSQQSNTEKDFDILERNHRQLLESGCYFGALDSSSARRLLKSASTGTFLIRDSSDSNYLYSLSVKTERGATSVRILYADGLFQFDSDERVRRRLPQFESVMSLVDFHVLLSQDGKNKRWRWEDNSGNRMMKVILDKPKKCSVPSLSHLSRIKINQCLEDVHVPECSVDRLPMLPSRLKYYLKEYPYRL